MTLVHHKYNTEAFHHLISIINYKQVIFVSSTPFFIVNPPRLQHTINPPCHIAELRVKAMHYDVSCLSDAFNHNHHLFNVSRRIVKPVNLPAYTKPPPHPPAISGSRRTHDGVSDGLVQCVVLDPAVRRSGRLAGHVNLAADLRGVHAGFVVHLSHHRGASRVRQASDTGRTSVGR